ncbi:hypothetical protein JNB91_23730 [Rhizobium wenxiniae]|uniref:glycosyltransferase family 8 protein n=1 Tax=Rhizobium wenxiniae TaxID=1737357 RepID=UPI001C6F1DBF|nr:glycosyltransferase [Rhizobium wenxiniae]MBW9090826.1 hypothetical protein [Rhizobium wenxiniae]
MFNRDDSRIDELLKEIKDLRKEVGEWRREAEKSTAKTATILTLASSKPANPVGLRPRRAVVTCITDNFITLGAVFIASLVENGNLPKTDEVDVVVISDPKFAPLSDDNKDTLFSILPKIRFIEPDTSYLSDDLVKRWDNGVVIKQVTDAELPSKKSVYLKLAILNLTEYDEILWMDSDMLVLKSIFELFSLPTKLAMVRGGKPHHHFGVSYGVQKMGFNSGLMLIKKPYISRNSFNEAVRLLNEKTHTVKQDQSLLNAQWLNEERMYLPHHYNWKMGLLNSDKTWDHAFDHARVLHFDGPCKFKLKEGTTNNKTTAAFHDYLRRYELRMIMEP